MTTTSEGLTQDFQKELIQLTDDLNYAALNIKGIRAEVLKITKGDGKLLLKLIAGLTTLGAKFSKRAAKASNTEAARQFVTTLSTLQVAETKSGPISLTGPRVLMAHAYLTLRVREMLFANGRLTVPGVKTDSPAPLCEPALSSLSDEFPLMQDFLQQFAMVLNDDAIKRNLANKRPDDMAAVQAMEQIRLVAVENHKRDPLYEGRHSDFAKLNIAGLVAAYGYKI